MCLVTEDNEISIAEKSIPCKKWVLDNRYYWSPAIYNKTSSGEIIERSYKFNVILDAEDDNNNKIFHLTIRVGGFYYTVNEGFHAIINEKSSYKKIAVIPKGAEYVISSNKHQIVSNKIIVFSNYFRYLMYRIFDE